jgi:hypothetical protein
LPGSIGCAYTYSGPFRVRADICTTTLGIPPSNLILSQSRAEQIVTFYKEFFPEKKC